jgi:uncharacterized protein YndB with AHSA1/START domain
MPWLIAVAAVAGVLGLAISRRPSDFRIERSKTIAAPPSAVFARLNDLHAWEAWSPWAELDPEMRTTYEGPASGVGARYSWTGNKKVGEGRVEITESRPNDLVQLRLEFLKPFKATNTTEFQLFPEEDGTRVSWTMTGRNNFVAKAFGVFVSMDEMVGKDFEKGLDRMKEVVEAGH